MLFLLISVESLIYWRDIKKSGVVFGSGLALLLALSCCSLISVSAYVSLIALAGTIAFRIYKNILQAIQKTAEGHPFKWVLDSAHIMTDLELDNECETIQRSHAITVTIMSCGSFFLFSRRDLLELDIALSQERIQQLATSAVAHVNAALIELRRLFLVEDLVDSIKFGVLLYCLTYVGAIFNGMTLIILGKQDPKGHWWACFNFWSFFSRIHWTLLSAKSIWNKQDSHRCSTWRSARKDHRSNWQVSIECILVDYIDALEIYAAWRISSLLFFKNKLFTSFLYKPLAYDVCRSNF